MEQLREETTKIFADLNKAWINEINTAAEENRGVDMSLKGKYSDYITEFNKSLNLCKERNPTSKKKKGWF